jgi:hypothetical protein
MNRGRTKTFDAYTRRARLAPALVASFPALALIGVSLTAADQALRAGGTIIGALGLVVCGLVRDRGRQIQEDLWEGWGGSPTLTRLRWRGVENSGQTERLHEKLSAILGRALPTEGEERADPVEADRHYDEAVAALRHRTIRRASFPLVFEENCEYGFRRNSLGLKNIAQAVSLASLVASGVLLFLAEGSFGSRVSRWGLSGGASLVMLLYWTFLVNERWVRRAAETYADRLFEALEGLASGQARPSS